MVVRIFKFYGTCLYCGEKMRFKYDIDTLVTKTGIRKDNVKRRIIIFGFEEDIDYKIRRPYKRYPKKELITLSSHCYHQVLLHFKLRKRNICDSDNTNIKYIKRYIPEEIEIITFVYDVLCPLYKVYKQYHVGKYRVDLYIKDINLIIECDENEHKYYNKEYEKTRERFIKQKLNCRFYRFNPNDKSFNVKKVLSDIFILSNKCQKI